MDQPPQKLLAVDTGLIHIVLDLRPRFLQLRVALRAGVGQNGRRFLLRSLSDSQSTVEIRGTSQLLEHFNDGRFGPHKV